MTLLFFFILLNFLRFFFIFFFHPEKNVLRARIHSTIITLAFGFVASARLNAPINHAPCAARLQSDFAIFDVITVMNQTPGRATFSPYFSLSLSHSPLYGNRF